MKNIHHIDHTGITCKKEGHSWEKVGVVPETTEQVYICIICGIAATDKERRTHEK